MRETIFEAYKNISDTCKVGRDPEYRKAGLREWDNSRFSEMRPGGKHFYAGPGDVVIREDGVVGLMMSKGGEFFVECHDEREADRLRVPKKARVLAPDNPELTAHPGKLAGFFGVQYVMKNVTAEYADTYRRTADRVIAAKKVKEMEDAIAANAERETSLTDEVARLRAQVEEFRRQQVLSLESTRATGKK